jgi:hypothetical protein
MHLISKKGGHKQDKSASGNKEKKKAYTPGLKRKQDSPKMETPM